MATHPSILAWRILWTEDPSGLQSMGSQRVRPSNFQLPTVGFPGGSDGKESAAHAGDLGLIPGSGRSPGERNGNPFQYSCLENPMDRGARWATACGVTKRDTTE